MEIGKFIEKGRRKFLKKRSSILFNTKLHPYLYSSYWHSITNKPSPNSSEQYLTARPNYGAGIGHQMANWIAGLWFSKVFNLKFAHSSFTENWEKILGLGEKFSSSNELLNSGYKLVRLPLFDEKDKKQLLRIQQIIDSYNNRKVLFILDIDQYYGDQFGVADELKNLFFQSSSRKFDQVEFMPNSINVACHIRRGDIIQRSNQPNENLAMRFQSDHYFERVMEQVSNCLKSQSNLHFYIYSQGNESDFYKYKNLGNVHFRINADQYSSFIHLTYADILITSKSSFSYKPALISNGIKICPREFWHGYPKTEDFILADNDGSFLTEHLIRKINNLHVIHA